MVQQRMADSDAKVAALKRAMSNPFVGFSAAALLDHLIKCRRLFREGAAGTRFYAKFTSVCNSSGTGKTRAVLQLRDHHVPVVYINLRPVSDSLNYPPSDDEIAPLLKRSTDTATQFFLSCIILFRALFQQLLVEFIQRSPDSAQRSAADFVEMVTKWNDDFTADVSLENQNRREFLGAVRDLHTEMAKGSPSDTHAALLKHDHNQLCQFLETFRMENESPSKDTAPPIPSGSPMLVIAIDEPQELTEPRGGHNDAYSPFHLLGRAIKVFSESRSPGPDAWVVFLSTNSKVTHFAAPAVIRMYALTFSIFITLTDLADPSQRVLNEGQLIFPPFCLLQWDTFDEPKNVLSVGNYEDTISFGRPLWKSVNSLELYRKPEAMSKFALTKLINSDVNRINLISNEMALAVLGQRFAIDFLFGAWEAVPFVDTSVASHMRVLTSTTEDRSWQYTTYPSEPVLSNAAAQFMYMEEQTVSWLSRTLVQTIFDGLVDAGEVGELISRLLILISRDFAAILNYRIQIAGDSPKSRSPPLSQRFPSSHGDFFPYLRPVPLLDVLDILLGLEWLSECREDIVSAFKRAYISASHWNVLSKDIGPLLNVTASDWLKSYFLCGVAVQCHHDQPLIDKVVPILFLDAAGQYASISAPKD
ncbi:hypothetical protein K435DRAFT_418238 [Dendrothele bispora CBS 962.96]|uniref:Uncharacterized protein n=1 Tax=Dendrothele bispora (strain CBS 962.96) TaxID=1314807 RepID=A0A4S8MUT5_DENBC|nr:hypothetical protein K435DRAFT_418238 [Dendrothele bispora CBS 962.96]